MSPLKMTREEFDARKEISRFPKCPELSKEEVSEVTKTVFAKSNPQPADIFFIFGSSKDDRWDQVADKIKLGLAPVVYIAGGIGGASFKTGRILSHIIRDNLIALGVSDNIIIVDEQSTNTMEDAINGKELFVAKTIPHKRILFACKWPHSGRCLRTMKKVFPDSELFPFLYDFKYESVNITSEIVNTWYENEVSRSFVWGEYERIKLYSSRGQIPYNI